MRIDAIFVLFLGALSYLHFMIQVYHDVPLALCIFLASGAFGVWTGLACGSVSSGKDRDD